MSDLPGEVEPDPDAPGYNRGVWDIDATVAQARADERDACARLAEQHKVTWQERKSCNCGRIHPGTGEPCTYTVGPPLPFADLIRARSE